jgi:hypothetical protein
MSRLTLQHVHIPTYYTLGAPTDYTLGAPTYYTPGAPTDYTLGGDDVTDSLCSGHISS